MLLWIAWKIQVLCPDTFGHVKYVVLTVWLLLLLLEPTVGQSVKNHGPSERKRVASWLLPYSPPLCHSFCRKHHLVDLRWRVEVVLCRECWLKRCYETPELLTLRRILLPSASLCRDLVSPFLYFFFFLNHPFQNDLGCSLKVCNTLLKHLKHHLSTFVGWLKYWFFQNSAKMAQESAMTMKTILEKIYVFAWRCCQSNEDFAIT